MFFMYFCVLWHNHYVSMTQHSQKGENWASFWISCSHLSVLIRKSLKKLSFQMQVYSLSCANCRLHSKYSQNIAIIFQFIFCEKKKKTNFVYCLFFIYFIWLLSRGIRALFFATGFRHGKVRENSYNLFY